MRELDAVDRIEQRLRGTIAAAREEVFEDGMETQFSRAIVLCFEEDGGGAADAFRCVLTDPSLSAEAVGEALRWIGHIDDETTREARRELFETALDDPRVEVRDGAILALSFMDDPEAVPALRRAAASEQVACLRADIEQILEELQETDRCRSSSGA